VSALHLLGALLLAALPASSESAAGAPAAPRLVLSLQLPALLTTGLDVQAEAYLGDATWSVAADVGGRLPAGGDFRALHMSAGAEVRRWLWRGGPLVALEEVPLGGAFAAARLDVGWTRLTHVDGRSLGSALRLTPGLVLGYRFFPLLRLELTPTAGLGLSTTLDASGRLPPASRPHAIFGLTLGWVL
jgi:hypothetical protein